MELINEKNSLHWKRNKQEIPLQKKNCQIQIIYFLF